MVTIESVKLELRHLRYFSMVADELHFGRAAARLTLSQPALSVQIRQLEEMVGAQLFERHSRMVALTDAGRAFDEAAQRILRDVDAAIQAARLAGAGHSGVLRVGFSPTLMISTLSQVVRAFRAKYPAVRVDLRELASAEQVEALLRGDLDLAFMRATVTEPRLHAELFMREPLLIAVHRDHAVAKQQQVRLSSLAKEPWVLFPRAIAPQLHEQVLGLCRQAGFVPNVVQESREVYTTVGLVGAGVGVTIIPATIQQMASQFVVYKRIPRASVRLTMVRPAGQVRPVVEEFLALARKAGRK